MAVLFPRRLPFLRSPLSPRPIARSVSTICGRPAARRLFDGSLIGRSPNDQGAAADRDAARVAAISRELLAWGKLEHDRAPRVDSRLVGRLRASIDRISARAWITTYTCSAVFATASASARKSSRGFAFTTLRPCGRAIDCGPVGSRCGRVRLLHDHSPSFHYSAFARERDPAAR